MGTDDLSAFRLFGFRTTKVPSPLLKLEKESLKTQLSKLQDLLNPRNGDFGSIKIPITSLICSSQCWLQLIKLYVVLSCCVKFEALEDEPPRTWARAPNSACLTGMQ